MNELTGKRSRTRAGVSRTRLNRCPIFRGVILTARRKSICCGRRTSGVANNTAVEAEEGDRRGALPTSSRNLGHPVIALAVNGFLPWAAGATGNVVHYQNRLLRVRIRSNQSKSRCPSGYGGTHACLVWSKRPSLKLILLRRQSSDAKRPIDRLALWN